MIERWTVHVGDCREVLRGLPEGSVQTCVTSPPYWSQREYDVQLTVWGGRDDCDHEWGPETTRHKGGPAGRGALREGGRAIIDAQAKVKDISTGSCCVRCGAWRGQLGLDPTPDLYVAHLVSVFREVRRVLRPNGTLWIVIGDSWASSPRGNRGNAEGDTARSTLTNPMRQDSVGRRTSTVVDGLKPKDLVGIPWALAFALRADGWWLRDEIIWSKTSCMPYPARDRTVRSHEQVFLLSRSGTYFYDASALAEPSRRRHSGNVSRKRGNDVGRPGHALGRSIPWSGDTRLARSVWSVAPQPSADQHFATYPVELARRCIVSATRRGDVVLDPFAGTGRTGVAALLCGRRFIGVELSESYAAIAKRTLAAPLARRRRRIEVESEQVALAMDGGGSDADAP